MPQEHRRRPSSETKRMPQALPCCCGRWWRPRGSRPPCKRPPQHLPAAFHAAPYLRGGTGGEPLSHPVWANSGRVGHRVHCGALAPGQRAGGTPLAYPSRPAGGRTAPGGRDHPGGGQCLPPRVPGPRYRARFAVPPASPESAYVPVSPETDLNRLFCFTHTRSVAPDNTLRFEGRVLQLPPGPDRVSYARVVAEVHERLDHSIAVYYRGRQLLAAPGEASLPLRTRRRRDQRAYLEVPPQQSGGAQEGSTREPDSLSTTPVTSRRSWKPAPDHDCYCGQNH